MVAEAILELEQVGHWRVLECTVTGSANARAVVPYLRADTDTPESFYLVPLVEQAFVGLPSDAAALLRSVLLDLLSVFGDSLFCVWERRAEVHEQWHDLLESRAALARTLLGAGYRFFTHNGYVSIHPRHERSL